MEAVRFGPCASMDSPTVALVYTHGESVKSVFMTALIDNVIMDRECSSHVGLIRGQAGTLIARARNAAARWFVDDTDMDWLWFIDADMEPQPYTLLDLLSAVDVPCVASAATNGLSAEGPMLTWARKDDGGTLRRVLEADAPRMNIDACGAACTLIHREVLLRVREQHATDPWPWFGHDLDGNVRLGEDYTFCARATAAGFPIYGVDTPVRHFKLLPI